MADLVTTSEYKAYAGITVSTYDTLIGVLIDIACAQIRRYCGRNLTNGFETATRTELYDGNGSAELQLKEWPVTSITSVTLVDDAGGTSALETTGDYRADLNTGVLRRLGAQHGRFAYDDMGQVSAPGWGVSPCWDDGFQNWSVVYVGGYTTIPDDLKYACYQVIDWLYAERRKNPALQSESLGSYSYTRMSMSEDSQAAILRGILATFKTGGMA